jgi:hypothetical protein
MLTNSLHDRPYMSREYGQAVSKMGPTIVVGSAKAQGTKAKPSNGSELPRATCDTPSFTVAAIVLER